MLRKKTLKLNHTSDKYLPRLFLSVISPRIGVFAVSPTLRNAKNPNELAINTPSPNVGFMILIKNGTAINVAADRFLKVQLIA